MGLTTVQFAGHECCQLENDSLKLLVTKWVGPRIISLSFIHGDNLFAVLPDDVLQCPGNGTFHFYGGHRLWVAPEDPARTYLPDDSQVDIFQSDVGLLVTQRVEPQSGLQKSIEIRLVSGGRVEVIHRIANHSASTVTCAPWALTQFKPGGIAILPQAGHDAGVLPNRSLALWSYTDMADPNVVWGRDLILVHAAMHSPFKVGFPNPRGWLAYWLDGSLFVKHVQYDARAEYYDRGSSSECYCNDKFLELETLSPIQAISPGQAATHLETWELHRDISKPDDEAAAKSLAERLGLR